MPASIAAKLPQALREAKAAVEPAGPKALAVELDRLMAFARAFNVPAEDIRGAVEFYRESLSHLPADLLSLAFKRVRATHKWGMRLPMPAEIISMVEEEFCRRRIVLFRLEAAMSAPVESDERPAPEDRARALAALNEAKASLRAESGPVDWWKPEDLGPEPAPDYARRVADELARIGPALRKIREEELGA